MFNVKMNGLQKQYLFRNLIKIGAILDVLNDLELNTSLKLDRFFDIKTPPKMNPYFWCNLSSENQTELCEISKLLELVQTDKANEFTIYK